MIYTKTDIQWFYKLLKPISDIVVVINTELDTVCYYIVYMSNGLLWCDPMPLRSFKTLKKKGIIVACGGNVNADKKIKYIKYHVPNKEFVIKELKRQTKGKFDVGL